MCIKAKTLENTEKRRTVTNLHDYPGNQNGNCSPQTRNNTFNGKAESCNVE